MSIISIVRSLPARRLPLAVYRLTHRFQIRLRGQPVVAVEIPVLAAEVASQALVQ